MRHSKRNYKSRGGEVNNGQAPPMTKNTENDASFLGIFSNPVKNLLNLFAGSSAPAGATTGTASTGQGQQQAVQKSEILTTESGQSATTTETSSAGSTGGKRSSKRKRRSKRTTKSNKK